MFDQGQQLYEANCVGPVIRAGSGFAALRKREVTDLRRPASAANGGGLVTTGEVRDFWHCLDAALPSESGENALTLPI